VSQGALVCLEPKTGYIRAMVGGMDFKASQFNRAVQAKRQPGSAFKVFVYTAAIANGVRPDKTYSNGRISFKGVNGRIWSPKNYNGKYGGRKTVRSAVALSVNVIAVRVLDEIGVNEAIKYARLMGITSPLEPYLSLALGSSVVTPLEMASAVGVLAAGGFRAEPTPILRLEDAEGIVIEEANPVLRRALSDNVVKTMNELLRGVVTSGTGHQAAVVPNARGKTGTTNEHRDVWFVGYVPELVTAVWAGNDDFSAMRRAAGGTVCAPIWTNFMLKALKIYHSIEAERTPGETENKPMIKVSEPDNEAATERINVPPVDNRHGSDTVTRVVCNESLFLATSGCPAKHRDSFASGFEPTEYCPVHKPIRRTRSRGSEVKKSNTSELPLNEESANQEVVNVTICADTGRIANKYCPHIVVRTYRVGEQPTQVCESHRSINTNQ